MTPRRSLVLAAAGATLFFGFGCTTDRAANLRHPVGGTARLTAAAVSPEERYAGTPPRTPTSTAVDDASCGAGLRALEFRQGAATLEPSEKRELEAAVTCLEAHAEGTTIVLVGHADPGASGAVSPSLGAERAAEVRDELVRRGVPGDRIIVTAPAGSAAPTSYGERSRAVEMFVHDGRNRR